MQQAEKQLLLKRLFPHLPYVSLENLDTPQTALEDPRKFLEQFPNSAVIDEAQRAPSLFSYLQTLVDQKKQDLLFILTGSQNFLLMENISQSLAGRVAICQLLPLSLDERFIKLCAGRTGQILNLSSIANDW